MHHFTRLLTLLATVLLLAPAARAQTGGVTIGAAQAADPTAVLDLVASDRGALLPRLTAMQRLGITAPAAGLVVYQTDAPTSGTGAGTLPGFWFNGGPAAAPAWQRLADSRGVSYDPATGFTVGAPYTTSTTSPSGTGTGNVFPFWQSGVEDMKYQVLVPAAQLTGVGLTAGNLVELALTIAVKGSTKPYLGFTVQLGSTTATSLSGFYTGTLTTVYTAPAAGYSTVAGVNAWPFAQPYYWDGTSNLVVQLCYDNPAGYTAGTSNDRILCYVNASNGQRIYGYASGGAGCSLTGGTVDNVVPALRFQAGVGYTLPATGGAVGQVLTQGTGAVVSFQTPPWTQTGSAVAPSSATSVGIGTATPFSQLANTSQNVIAGDGRGGNGGSLAWTASQAGYAAMIYNAQTLSPASGLAVKVAGTDGDINVLDVSAGATQTSMGTPLLDVKADGAVVIPGTLAVGSRLRAGVLVHSSQTLAMPTAATTVTLTAALLKLTDNGSAASNGPLTLGTTGVLEGQQVLVANLDAQAVGVTSTAGTIGVAYGTAARFVFVSGGWLREL